MPWQPRQAKWPVLRTTRDVLPQPPPCHIGGIKRNSSHTPGKQRTPPVSFRHPLLLPSDNPSFPLSNPAPGLSAGHLQRSLPQQSHGPPRGSHLCSMSLCCLHRHISGLTIPPDAGREKLNKTSWWDDIKNKPSHRSKGS